MILKSYRAKLLFHFSKNIHIAPLAVLRIAFGAVMFISTLRFILKGWIADFYVKPKFYFTFYCFDWVKPFGETGMYIVFTVMALASICIMIGLFYRMAVVAFFISFLYVELIDKTNYLNHYYLVTLTAFLLMLVPAHRYFSVDVLRKSSLKVTRVPAWTIDIFKLQFLIVYFFAGIAKLNYEWLIEAIPLRIWLPANEHLQFVGPLMDKAWVAYFFSWFGMIYDLSIVFFLLNRKTRNIAYLFIVIFHLISGWLFKIGMFPYIMIAFTLIFFSENFHKKLLEKLRILFKCLNKTNLSETVQTLEIPLLKRKMIYGILILYFILQALLPFRYLLYHGKLFWTEEGYRFSWRVMLMEKSGITFFYVKDPKTGNKCEIINADFLTSLQEKMMSTQPDMILQYAHFLDQEYKKNGINDPLVYVQSYVNLNGSGSQLFIDSSIDLSAEKERLFTKKWILPFHNN